MGSPPTPATRPCARFATEFANKRRVNFAETVEIREYVVEEVLVIEEEGLVVDPAERVPVPAAEPAAGTTVGRKRGRPPYSEEWKLEKEVEAAKRKAERAEEAFDKKRKELGESGAWWDEQRRRRRRCDVSALAMSGVTVSVL